MKLAEFLAHEADLAAAGRYTPTERHDLHLVRAALEPARIACQAAGRPLQAVMRQPWRERDHRLEQRLEADYRDAVATFEEVSRAAALVEMRVEHDRQVRKAAVQAAWQRQVDEHRAAEVAATPSLGVHVFGSDEERAEFYAAVTEPAPRRPGPIARLFGRDQAAA